MKKFLPIFVGGAVLALASGCAVVPPRGGLAVAVPGVAYVAPGYASPGVGWVWQFHPSFGWGWHHPEYGWHQGWR